MLNRTVANTLVWNFLPPIHESAWSDEHTYEGLVRVKFVREKGGQRTEVENDLEPLQGKLVNFIVRDALESVDPLAEWTHPDGYTVDAEQTRTDETTKTTTLTFVKR